MLGTDMCPSSAISFTSGLDRGVPWGPDLITFMTSAAGYMMRTLQKPRKNKPSKRQVNHRRFLHNMIQRKFTEIEAANHQLATALFSADTESPGQSDIQATHKDESEKNPKKATSVFGEAETKPLDEDEGNNSDGTVNWLVTNLNESSSVKNIRNNMNNGKVNQIRKDRVEEEYSGENLPQEITDFTGERQQIQWASVGLSDLTPISNIILEDTLCTPLEVIEKRTDSSHVQIPDSPDREQHQQQQQQHSALTWFDLPPASPVSPLSLNSCDFEVQIHPDIDHASQLQHIAEDLQMDLMDNLEVLDSIEYLQQIDRMDMIADFDIHNEEDLNCFQDSVLLHNTSHTHFAMERQAAVGNGDIGGGLGHQINTMIGNPVNDINVLDNELKSNHTYSLEQHGSVGYHNPEKQVRTTAGCYLNPPEINTSVQNARTVCEQELAHNLLDENQLQNWEQHISYYNHAPNKLKDPYYTLSIEENNITSRPSLNLNSDISSPVTPLSMSLADGCGFDTPLHTTSICLTDSCSFSNHKGDQSIPSFEGVAQSFPVPYQNSHSHSVSTPPLNDDWLFSNIAPEVDLEEYSQITWTHLL